MHGLLDRRPEMDDPSWLVADRDGRILASRLCLRQLQARLDHGLLRDAAWIAHEADGAWRPLTAIDEVGERGEAQWYLMRHGSALVGPVGTAQLRRGVEAGRVPTDTYVCRLGEPSWKPIEDCTEFEDLFAGVMETVTRSVAVLPRWSRVS